MDVDISGAVIEDVSETIPQLKRGLVWCTKCGNSQRVDSRQCLSHGWPECCGETMTIDSPEERARLKRRDDHGMVPS